MEEPLSWRHGAPPLPPDPSSTSHLRHRCFFFSRRQKDRSLSRFRVASLNNSHPPPNSLPGRVRVRFMGRRRPWTVAKSVLWFVQRTVCDARPDLMWIANLNRDERTAKLWPGMTPSWVAAISIVAKATVAIITHWTGVRKGTHTTAGGCLANHKLLCNILDEQHWFATDGWRRFNLQQVWNAHMETLLWLESKLGGFNVNW